LTHTGFGFLFGVIIHLENYRPTESRNRLLTLKSKLSSDFIRSRAKISPFTEITAKSPFYCLGGSKTGVQAASAVALKPETSPICPFLAPLTAFLSSLV
jgi:hypothetical protein